MSPTQTIMKLADMLHSAAEIISQQAALLEMHGIHTETGQLERERAELIEEVERLV